MVPNRLPLLLYVFLMLLTLTKWSCQNPSILQKDPFDLETKLSGKWSASAFDGVLLEEWKKDHDGWMVQEGYYVENSDTSYAARTKILQIDKQWVLFSVIRNSNPKIFQATKVEEDQMIFENAEYQNPKVVEYLFQNKSTYTRIIRGLEGDSLVSYTFNFQK